MINVSESCNTCGIICPVKPLGVLINWIFLITYGLIVETVSIILVILFLKKTTIKTIVIIKPFLITFGPLKFTIWFFPRKKYRF